MFIPDVIFPTHNGGQKRSMAIRFTGFVLIDSESARFMQMPSALCHDLLHLQSEFVFLDPS